MDVEDGLNREDFASYMASVLDANLSRGVQSLIQINAIAARMKEAKSVSSQAAIKDNNAINFAFSMEAMRCKENAMQPFNLFVLFTQFLSVDNFFQP